MDDYWNVFEFDELNIGTGFGRPKLAKNLSHFEDLWTKNATSLTKNSASLAILDEFWTKSCEKSDEMLDEKNPKNCRKSAKIMKIWRQSLPVYSDT